MPSTLLAPGNAHYLWCRYLAGQGSLPAVNGRLELLGRARWTVPGRRRRAVEMFRGLQQSALAAGLTGRLTEESAEGLARKHVLMRPRLDIAPLLVSAWRDELVSQFLEIHGAEHLVQAAESGKGLVLAGAHFGMMGGVVAWLVRQGYQVVVLRDSQFRQFVGTPHGRHFFGGATPLFIDRNNPETPQGVVRAVARYLKQGAVVAYTADAGHGSRVAAVEVLGRLLEIRTALPALAARGGSYVAANFGVGVEQGVRSYIGTLRVLKGEEDVAAFGEEYAREFQRVLLDFPESAMDYETSWRLAGAF